MSKRVAIIGGGCGGLASIKSCLEEGLEPVCFERTDRLGGLWNYTEQPVRDGQGCVMRSTVINTSKEMMCFSDYPMPKHYPNYTHNTLVSQYFKDYAKNFQLKQYIQYNTEVTMVSPALDYDSTGRWNLQILDHKSGEQSKDTFDAVMVCTGHHAQKNEPSLPGLADFKGQVMHSHEYREPSGFANKRILIIGIGNSGGDMAVELSRQGQVFLSTRRGTWIMNRVDRNGMPFDVLLANRVSFFLKNFFPKAFMNALLAVRMNMRLDHDLYGLRPDHGPLDQHIMVNDDLGNRIICGSVKVKDDVKRFTATGVEFIDGSFEDNIDVVVLATGYKFGFPFIDKTVVDIKNNRNPFYLFMFPPELKHHTLAAIGCAQPNGALAPFSEMQTRLAAHVFSGKAKLPSTSEMLADVRSKDADRTKQYTTSKRHTIQIDYIPIMDQMSALCGCKPNILYLFLTDPSLALQVVFGPITPYQYRLMGTGKWNGARKAIMTTMDRVRYPLATRPLPASPRQRAMEKCLRMFIFLVAVSFLLFAIIPWL